MTREIAALVQALNDVEAKIEDADEQLAIAVAVFIRSALRGFTVRELKAELLEAGLWVQASVIGAALARATDRGILERTDGPMPSFRASDEFRAAVQECDCAASTTPLVTDPKNPLLIARAYPAPGGAGSMMFTVVDPTRSPFLSDKKTTAAERRAGWVIFMAELLVHEVRRSKWRVVDFVANVRERRVAPLVGVEAPAGEAAEDTTNIVLAWIEDDGEHIHTCWRVTGSAENGAAISASIIDAVIPKRDRVEFWQELPERLDCALGSTHWAGARTKN